MPSCSDGAGAPAKPPVVGNRGASGLPPEKTLAAFKCGCGLGIGDFNGSALRTVNTAGGRIWPSYFKNLTPETLAEARRLGFLVSVRAPGSPDERGVPSAASLGPRE